MSTITCNHIKYDEIERCMNADVEDLSHDDLIFFESFGDRLSTCDVCCERLRVYYLLSPMIDSPPDLDDDDMDELDSMSPQTVSVLRKWDMPTQEAARQFKAYLQQQYGGNIRHFYGRCKIAPVTNIDISTSRRYQENNEDTDIDDNDLPIVMNVDQSETIFAFELADNTKVRIDILDGIATEGEYELRLWRLPDGQIRDTYFIKKGETTVKTDNLCVGKYLAVMVEGGKNE